MPQNTEKHTIMENTPSDVLFEDAAHFENLDDWRRANGKPTFAEYHGGFGVEWFYHPLC